MGGVNFDTIESKALQLGGGKFEQGSITVAPGATIKAGTILKRSGERTFAPAEDGDELVAVAPSDLTNKGADEASLGFRALIGGSVRKDMLNLGGEAIGSGQADALRKYGIIAVETTDVSRVSPDTRA